MIGDKTIKTISKIIDNSKTILWNGPAGYFEIDEFSQGSNEIAKKIAENTKNKSLISIAGGGDTVAAINKFNCSDGFTYILYAYHASKLLYPKLNFEHDEYGYFRLSDLTVSPTPMCPKVSSSLIDYDKRRWKGGSIII